MASTINSTDTGQGGLITTGDSSDELQLQTAETTAITINSTQQAIFTAGSASAPAITTTGDTNTGIFFPSADTIAFAEGGAEAARFNSSGNLAFPNGQGIDFSASAGGGATSSLLDDYEEGTWTPGVAFGGASAGVTYGSDNSGVYTKVGRVVTALARISLTSKGSSTGDATITGLPFTVASSPDAQFSGVVAFSVVENFTFADIPTGRSNGGTTTASLYETTNAGAISTITNADFANNTNLRFTIIYYV